MNVKYIIVKKDMLEVPVLFSGVLLHHEVAGQGQVLSAGFCARKGDGKWRVAGRSASLNLGPRPQDAEILNLHFGAGRLADDLDDGFWVPSSEPNRA